MRQPTLRLHGIARRPATMGALSVTAFCLMTSFTLLGIRHAYTGIERWRTTQTLAAMRAECHELQTENDRVIELLQKRDRSLQLPMSEYTPLVGGDCGLTLEVLFQHEVGGTKIGVGTQWHMISSGSAAAWGQFLVEMETSNRLDGLESATWTTDEWIGRQVRGEIVLRSLQGTNQ